MDKDIALVCIDKDMLAAVSGRYRLAHLFQDHVLELVGSKDSEQATRRLDASEDSLLEAIGN